MMVFPSKVKFPGERLLQIFCLALRREAHGASGGEPIP